MQNIPLKGKLKKFLPESVAARYSRLTAGQSPDNLLPRISAMKREEIKELLREDVLKLREWANRDFESGASE